ncbi:TRAF3-interacting JNK-activating modulator-like isoform X2 [Meleagris gallopavo]|uniref:TRAF3-interacting JNK-activating modulator-like isoform X2 n=1 Tax=Meleagris gallopavo TaxID=9103 RepID=UPI000549D281|nr:TRAF3-interacting JNK-activating modulator-like isoform X2 [Meleagris gallopavo]
MLKSEWAQMAKAHRELKSNLHALQSQLQHTATRNEELCQALDFLQHEHAELQQHADTLQQDNQLQAKRICNIEGKLQKEQNQKLILEATISHLRNLMQNQTNEQKTQEVMVQRKDQVFTTQNPPLNPAKEMQNVLSEHPKEKAEESLRDEMQERTSQLTAKEKECQELRAELEALSEEYRCCLSCLRQCRQELNQSQMVKRQPGNWLPLLLAVIAIAMAAVLASYRP